jgi:hypothetical protein
MQARYLEDLDRLIGVKIWGIADLPDGGSPMVRSGRMA